MSLLSRTLSQVTKKVLYSNAPLVRASSFHSFSFDVPQTKAPEVLWSGNSVNHEDMWITGAFPKTPVPMHDTSSMLSALPLVYTEQEFPAVHQVLQNLPTEILASSVLKKRRTKMRKHKHKKRMKLQRRKNK